MTLQLRPYQQDAVDALFQWWNERDGNTLIEIPTGGGKSLIMAEIAKQCLTYPNTRIVVVTHVRELVEQDAAELAGIWPEAPIGINSAALRRRDTQTPITFCSIQSVYKAAHKFQRVDIVFIDEAHLIPRKSDTMYQRFLRDLLIINPYCKVVGLTATPFRLDSGRLDDGDDKLFDGACYEYGIRDAIEAGYLCRPVSKQTAMTLDTTGVGTRGGEFIPAELSRAVDKDEINREAVEEIVGRGQDRKSWLVFCTGVKHAEHVRDLIRAKGVSCEMLTGETPAAERKQIVADYKAGRTRALVSVNVVLIGFNARSVDLIALLRPTQSAGIYIQAIGRGLRLSPETGKTDCLILDFAGNIARFGPIDDVKIKKPGPGGGPPPFKTCPECETHCATATRVCAECGHEFPPPEPYVEPRASALPILSTEKAPEPEWVGVDHVGYRIHQKPEKPPSLQVTYQCGLLEHKEWVCFQHGGYAAGKAAQWWLAHGGAKPWPRTTEEAMNRKGELARVVEVKVKKNGKFTEIAGARYALPNLPDAPSARLRIHESSDARV